MPDIDWRKVAVFAYRAYAAATDNKNFMGEDMPKFDELPERVQAAWVAAVQEAKRVATHDAFALLRAWRACMSEPRPSDWERIVTHLLEDTGTLLKGNTQMIYSIEELNSDPERRIRVLFHDGQTVVELRGGNAAVIALTFENLKTHDEMRADDYMAGVVAGIIHTVMTGIPVVRAGG